MTRRLVCVGAGLSGLVSAYAAVKAARAQGTSIEVTVLEASARAGGNLVTERHEGFLIDGGPDSWVAAKPEATALCRELGLGDAIIETIPENRRVYLAHRGGLVKMPEGVVLGVPTKLGPMLRTPLLSWSAKARLVADLVLPPTEVPEGDVSIGELVARRLGREAAGAFVEPLLAGIYAGDAWSLSARATFPQLVEFAKRDRSLMHAARAAAPKRHAGGAPPSAFHSLRDGVGSLVDALVKALPEGSVRFGSPVASVTPGTETRWRVTLADGSHLDADDVVLGASTHLAATLVRPTSAPLADALAAVPYTSAATVFFAYPRRALAHPLDATGFVVPKREGMRLLAGTWVSSKWPHRAPEGTVLLRGFLGGLGREGALDRPDDELVSEARIDLERLMRFRAEPLFTRVYRFRQTSPLPSVGHHARVAAIRALLAAHPGLHAIGSAYEGVGIPDTIRLATKTGDAIGRG